MERVLAKASLGPRGGAHHGADAHQPPLPRAAAAAAGPAASPSAPADSTGIPTVSPPVQDRLSDCLSPRVNEIAESESESNLQSSLGREYCDTVPFATVRELDLIENEKTIKSSVEAHLTELIMTPLTLAYETYIAKPNADKTAAGELFAAMSESVESEEELLRMSLPARVLFAHVVTKPTSLTPKTRGPGQVTMKEAFMEGPRRGMYPKESELPDAVKFAHFSSTHGQHCRIYEWIVHNEPKIRDL